MEKINKLIEELKSNIEFTDFYGHNSEEIKDALITLEELKAAINDTHCCKSDSDLLKGKHPMTFAKWRESEGYTPYDNRSYQKDNKIFNVEKLEIKYRAYYKTF